MTFLKINRGIRANDRSAEPIYNAWGKVNANFEMIDEQGIGKIAADAYASEVIAKAGADNILVMTALRVVQSIYENAAEANWTAADTEDAITRTVRAKLRDLVCPDDFGAPGDGVSDDSAAFAAAKLVNDRLLLTNGKTYVTNSWKPDGRTIVFGGGARVRRAPRATGATSAFDFSASYGSLFNVVFDQDIFLADGRVDPAKAAVSTIVSQPAANQIEVADASTFAVDMEPFFETSGRLATTTLSGRPRDATNVITGIAGNTLTLMYDVIGTATIGGRVIADYPLLKTGIGAFYTHMVDVAFQRFVVGYKMGGAGTSVGNGAPIHFGFRANNFVGAAFVQRENSAAEQFIGAMIEGSHTCTRTHVGDGSTVTFGYYWNITPRNHFKGRCFTVRLNGGSALIEGTDYSVNDFTGTITFTVPPALGINVSIAYTEYAGRGLLSIGKGGTVNGMGALSSIQVIGCSVGHEIRGGSGGPEYLNASTVNYDTCSFAGLLADDTNALVMGQVKSAFTPYGIILSNCHKCLIGPLHTAVAGSGNYHDLAQVPNRAAITVDPDCTGIRIPEVTWMDESDGYSVIGGQYVEWGHGIQAGQRLFPSGTAALPGIGFIGATGSGFSHLGSGRVGASVNGVTRLTFYDDGRLIVGSGGYFQYADGTTHRSGTGSPEGNITALVGSTYSRTDGASRFYVKATGTGNTGWIALLNATTGVPPDVAKALLLRGLAVSVTGTTAATALRTISVPAGVMGTNGLLRITTSWSHTNNANAKTMRVRFGGTSGTIYTQVDGANQARTTLQTFIQNKNLANSQTGLADVNALFPFGQSTTAPVTSAVDTTAAVDIVISGQLADAGDTLTLETCLVELFNA